MGLKVKVDSCRPNFDPQFKQNLELAGKNILHLIQRLSLILKYIRKKYVILKTESIAV